MRVGEGGERGDERGGKVGVLHFQTGRAQVWVGRAGKVWRRETKRRKLATVRCALVSLKLNGLNLVILVT